MKIKYLFLLMILAFLLLSTGCERAQSLDFELPFEGEKLVVYGLVTANGNVAVNVFRTKPTISNTEKILLDDLSATIIDQDEVATDFVFNGNRGATRISANNTDNTYRLSVVQKELSVVSEMIVLPSSVPIDRVTYAYAEDSLSVHVSLYFEDKNTEVNYYTYAITTKKEGEVVETEPANFQSLLVDEDFSGETHRINMEVEIRTPVFGENFQLIEISEVDEIIIHFYNVSHQVYDFYQSIQSNTSELGNQFSEQEPIQSNIIGGYGYFGGVAVDSFSISL